MKRKYLIILIVFVLLGAIIFLGYNIYIDINYVPRIESFEEVNITSNEIVQDTSQT